jgi:hypothetical protein
MEPSIRNMSYSAVKPVRLAVILAKVGRGTAAAGSAAAANKADRRRQESEMVSRLAMGNR